MGGDNSPENLASVTVEEHSELHLSLYLEHGHYEDWIAYHCLSGQITNREANRLNKLGDRNPAKRADVRKKISEKAKYQTNRAKNYIITYKNGTKCDIHNLKKFGRDNGYSYSGLKKLLLGTTKYLKDIQSIQRQ